MPKIILPKGMVIARVENGDEDEQNFVGKIVRIIETGYGDDAIYLEEIPDEEKGEQLEDDLQRTLHH